MNTTNRNIVDNIVTYKFGETPEEVIRERHEAILDVGETDSFEIADAIANVGGYADDADESDRRANVRDFLAAFIGADSFIALLNSLVQTATDAEPWNQDSSDAGKLRLNILATLGIKETVEGS